MALNALFQAEAHHITRQVQFKLKKQLRRNHTLFSKKIQVSALSRSLQKDQLLISCYRF